MADRAEEETRECQIVNGHEKEIGWALAQRRPTLGQHSVTVLWLAAVTALVEAADGIAAGSRATVKQGSITNRCNVARRGDSTTEVTLSPLSVCKYGGAFYVAELTVVLYRFDRCVAVRRWQRCCGIDISELTDAFLSWQTRWGVDIPGWQWRCVVDRHVAEFTDSLLSWQTRCWVDSGAAELTDALWSWQGRCWVDRGVTELTDTMLNR